MTKTIDDLVCDYLVALANGDRGAVIEAIADMNAMIDYEGAKPPSFSLVLDRMEGMLDCWPDEVSRAEYGSTRMSEVASRHAKRFHRDWIEHMPVRWRVLLSDDVFADVIRRAMEDLVGETRQEPSAPPTPNGVLAEMKAHFRTRRDS
jgi:hypothetical protein